MKTFTFIVLLLITRLVFAQYTVDATLYNNLNEKQLKAMLEQAEKEVSTGKGLTALGTVCIIVGTAAILEGQSKATKWGHEEEGLAAATIGSIVFAIGVVPFTFGAYKIIKGKNEQQKIRIHLMKFESYKPTYGIGITLALN